MNFTKMHGAGNDYLYVDARGLDRDWRALAAAMSDRHFGVGSDGIILLMTSEKADIRMRMFNADGSEGEMCGNGIRCLVGFAMDKGAIPYGAAAVSVETLAGTKDVAPMMEGLEMVGARVQMGEPRLHPDEIPVVAPGQDSVYDYPLKVNGRELKISCVSMGNPHAVAFFDEPVDGLALQELGPLVERHAMFPEGVNFEAVNVIDSSRLNVRVWERGSGLTLACGTGACAAVVMAHMHGYVAGNVSVDLPGGRLAVYWPGEGQVVMEGPVAKVFEGEWPE